MNEADLLRRLVQEPPVVDDMAMARARQRLRELMAEEPLQGKRKSTRTSRMSPLPWVAALVGLVLVTSVLQLVLPSGEGGPSRSAAREIEGLGRVAAASRSLDIPPGSYLYEQVEEVRPQTTSQLGNVSGTFTIVVHDTVRSWIAADGSGRRTTTFEGVSFASMTDEQAWRQGGSPPLPQVGSTTQETYASGDLLLFNVDALPTDPSALLDAIRSGIVAPAPQGDVNVLLLIGSLLAQGNASPQLRQALFRVAADLPSVTLDRGAVDPTGRRGVGILLAGSGQTAELVVDPNSSEILASELHDADGQVLSSQAFTDQEIVGSLSARPS